MTNVSSNNKKGAFKAEDCSISINGVLFSKSLNGASDMTEQIDENKIVMSSNAKTDFFNAPYGDQRQADAQVLLHTINNKEPFTFTVKVRPEFSETYDAGAAYMFVNNEHWLKFAFEMDEKKETRIVTVRTEKTSDDNNHDEVTEKYAYLKISSDVNTIGFYYSIDKVKWQLVRVLKNEFPEPVYIGISSQSPRGDGIKVAFEDVSLTNEAIKDFRKGV